MLFTDERTAREEQLPKGAIVRAVHARPTAGRGLAALAPRPRRACRGRPRASRLDVFLFPSVYTWFPVRGRRRSSASTTSIAEQYPELTLPGRGARARWRLKRRLAVQRAARIFTVSEASRTLLAADLGVPEASLAVVPEAPDPVFGPRSAEEIERELAPLGLGGGERFLVYAGGISPHKGLETLLDALRALGRAGAAPRRSPARSRTRPSCRRPASVRRQIAELGLDDRVLLTGFVSDETLACLYAGAVAFVSPSRSEGFGLPGRRGRRCRHAGRAQRHPGPPRDARRRGALLPARVTRARSPSSSTSVTRRRRAARRSSARRRGERVCRPLLGRLGRGARGPCCRRPRRG